MQDQLLKIAPQQQQVQYYSGTPVDLGVRIGTGLLVTLVVNKLPLLAAGSLCFPLWWPIYKAWWQNQKLRSQYRLSPSPCHSCLLILAVTVSSSNLFLPSPFSVPKKMSQRSSYKRLSAAYVYLGLPVAASNIAGYGEVLIPGMVGGRLAIDSTKACMHIHRVVAIAVVATGIRLDMYVYEDTVTQQRLATRPCLVAPWSSVF